MHVLQRLGGAPAGGCQRGGGLLGGALSGSRMLRVQVRLRSLRSPARCMRGAMETSSCHPLPVSPALCRGNGQAHHCTSYMLMLFP